MKEEKTGRLEWNPENFCINDRDSNYSLYIQVAKRNVEIEQKLLNGEDPQCSREQLIEAKERIDNRIRNEKEYRADLKRIQKEIDKYNNTSKSSWLKRLFSL